MDDDDERETLARAFDLAGYDPDPVALGLPGHDAGNGPHIEDER